MVARVRRRLQDCQKTCVTSKEETLYSHNFVHLIRGNVERIVNQILHDTSKHIQARQNEIHMIVHIGLHFQHKDSRERV